MSNKVSGAAALALLIGVSTLSLNTAVAQNGGEARSNDRAIQKKLDNRDLSPIRPIRRVGDDNWPNAKDQPAARETSGQSATDEKKNEKENTAQNTPKPDTKQSQSLGNQSPPPDKPQEMTKDKAKDTVQPKQDTAKQETPKQDNKQDTAQAKDQKNGKSFASIRLGTDENGRVAVNEAQERQIAKAMHKQRVENVKVSVGSVAPANVRLVAVSSELVEVLPQFRGDSFFATGDDIVIVEPSSKKVIALVPVKLTATASRAPEERPARTQARQIDTPATTRMAAKPRETVGGRTARIDDIPTREEILAAPVTRGPAGTTVTRTYRSYQYDPDDDDDVVVIQRRRPRFFGFW